MAERWTPLVVRNLLYGCHRFSDIARGVPAMSRSLLIKRLKELERSGVVVKTSDGTYELTEAGRDLAGVIESLETWGERWLDITAEHADPSFVLWAWAKYYLEPLTLPVRRVLVEFTFPDERPTNRRYWFLAERRSAELCYSHPGGEPDVYITARSEAFTRWHVGELAWSRALADGSITVSGVMSLARAVPTWNRHPPHRAVDLTPTRAPGRVI
jgi:DNA-binding HxlR family transcriptional regulator